MRRYLLLILVLLLCLVPTQASAALPRPDPKAVNLTLSDLPSGFTVASAVMRSNADAAKQGNGSLQQIIRSGRITTSEVQFDRSAVAGIILVDSTVELFHTAAQARGAFQASTARGFRLHKLAPMSVASVGAAHAGWTYRTKSTGFDATSDLVEFYRGQYDVLLFVAGLTGTFDTGQLDRLAGIVDHRIQSHG